MPIVQQYKKSLKKVSAELLSGILSKTIAVNITVQNVINARIHTVIILAFIPFFITVQTPFSKLIAYSYCFFDKYLPY